MRILGVYLVHKGSWNVFNKSKGEINFFFPRRPMSTFSQASHPIIRCHPKANADVRTLSEQRDFRQFLVRLGVTNGFRWNELHWKFIPAKRKDEYAMNRRHTNQLVVRQKMLYLSCFGFIASLGKHFVFSASNKISHLHLSSCWKEIRNEILLFYPFLRARKHAGKPGDSLVCLVKAKNGLSLSRFGVIASLSKSFFLLSSICLQFQPVGSKLENKISCCPVGSWAHRRTREAPETCCQPVCVLCGKPYPVQNDQLFSIFAFIASIFAQQRKKLPAVFHAYACTIWVFPLLLQLDLCFVSLTSSIPSCLQELRMNLLQNAKRFPVLKPETALQL